MAQPLFLEPVMHEKIWGGNRLAQEYGYAIPSDHTGECWAISAHPNGVSVIKSGPYKGLGLDDLYQKQPELFGNPSTDVFPLLTKILDANDWLSVQVHPDDTYAMIHEGELGKTECWYILSAEEGAEIIYGHQAKSREALADMIHSGDWEHLLTRVPARAGDFYFVPSGTIHAIGKGIMILETQQSSDTTYRVYDFDRKDADGNLRELHLSQSIDVAHIGQPQNSTPVTLKIDGMTSTLLVSNAFFAVYHWKVTRSVTMQQTAPYLLVSVIDGQGHLTVDNGVFCIRKGDHFILPNTVRNWRFDGPVEMIVSHVGER
ncbi:mannose-6-phosphate isomerase, class I [Streptococcus pluranimalium]|uniref:Mannose-6-phosphate isomerase n=1 Tax=Streptococcus agalactiae LMG 14747 TaxID=1154860 RepID=V6Z5X1_STRAG|nr:mannose-6-phosphate isomerase, class I [Streptococcus hyovaginalis]ESV55686.1 mannose-6-phosphate isomerase [Streptococcus agalactiae LMG 14747]MDY3024269.1 mannose-6-phosphate isomerase, class I [Streptococcus hyovaginalis]MDY4510252.1 mannose-6-phosphate isomerase, class I [Streptococcus hyovaginalis]MDY5973330.1 mannose-6-phosphate isomerase, class I [Streptococcus hyovaginalis]